LRRGEVVDTVTLGNAVRKHIIAGATLHTDEHSGYKGLATDYKHETVNHDAKVFSAGTITTNGVESVWAVFKRGVFGVYHHISPKHTVRYIDETAFRLNEGSVVYPTMDRINSLAKVCFEHRITYQDLIK